MHKRAFRWPGTAALALAALPGWLEPARADGAIAVGSTGDVVRDGIAFGMVIDEPKDKAAETAIRRCRTFQAKAAADRCEVVAMFAGECFAVAYDPKPGTPGAGWGVGPDQLAANQNAVAMCESSAGSARKGYCRVESGGCDMTGRRAAPSPAQAVGQPPGKPVAFEQPKEPPQASQSQPAAPPQPAASTAASEPMQWANPALETLPNAKPAASRQTDRPPAPAQSPWLPLGAMAGVALAYAAGQYVRGRLQGAVTEQQIMTGGGLAVAAAVIVKLLDLAGAGSLLAAAATAVAALAAAILA